MVVKWYDSNVSLSLVQQTNQSYNIKMSLLNAFSASTSNSHSLLLSWKLVVLETKLLKFTKINN